MQHFGINIFSINYNMKAYSPIIKRNPFVIAVRDYNRAGAKDFAKSIAKHMRHAARQEEKRIIDIGMEEAQLMRADEEYRKWHGLYPNEDMNLDQVSNAIMEEINRDYSEDWYRDMEEEREQYYLDREQQDDGIDPISEREEMYYHDIFMSDRNF
jgi:hypothetical protein